MSNRINNLNNELRMFVTNIESVGGGATRAPHAYSWIRHRIFWNKCVQTFLFF